MKTLTKRINRVLALVLTIAALAMGQSAWAENTWTVSNTSGSTFTITRSGDLSVAETVCFRTVSLSAIAGQHFTDISDQLTFGVDEDSKDVTVPELTPSVESYKYQTTTTRKYRFEVLDQGGFLLANCDRTYTTGSSISTSNFLNITKTGTIQSSAFKVTDKGYAQSGNPKTIASTAFYNAATQDYLGTAGAELHMTLEFQAKEEYDGYQYLQILTNETDCDTGAGNGDPGTISKSRYMAGFEIKSGGEYKTYKSYTFPVTTVGSGVGATNPWGYDTDKEKFPLSKQKFNTDCRASDGTLLLPIDFQTLAVRFNASGKDEDDWYVQNLKAKITAVDTQVPTLHDVKISGGPRAKGNTFYVSLAFTEIVRITGTTKKLSTSWGDLTYVDGDGTNVLTFSGTIGISATSPLVVNSLTGTVKDLSGNTFSTASVSHTFEGFILTASFAYPITYELNDGTVATANPASYTYDTPTFTLNNPAKEGNYYFAGWTGSNGDVPQTTVTINQYTHGALSYTAHWTKGYSVFFLANGGTGAMNQQDFNIDETKALTANPFSRANYFFTGWNTQADGSGTSYTDGQSVTNLAGSGETVTLYAQWTPDYSLWGKDDDHDGSTAEKAYIISTPNGLALLADQVNKGNTFAKTFFKLGDDITYSSTCAWNEENNTADNYLIIGDKTHSFDGTFDGDGKTISGIRVAQARDYVGLFSVIGIPGVVKNLTLSNTRIQVKGHYYIGAIAGLNKGSVVNCHVANDVCIVSNGTEVGGVVGMNNNNDTNTETNPRSVIQSCTSSVTIKWSGCNVGGILGNNYGGKVENCFAEGVQMPNTPRRAGAIVGSSRRESTILTNNYYHNCSVKNVMTNIGVGTNENASEDRDGARGVSEITLDEGISFTNQPETVTINNQTYYFSGDQITLSYSGEQQNVVFIVKRVGGGSDDIRTGATFDLPGYDVTVSITDHLWEGTGTAGDPYLIKNVNEMTLLIQKIHSYRGVTKNDFEGKYFQLTANLDFGSNSNQSILNDDGTTSRNFKGTFDGNGKYIKGITISPTGDTDHSIFGDLVGGTVKNLTVKNSSIQATASGEEPLSVSDYAFVCRNVIGGTIEKITVQDCTIDVKRDLTVNTVGAICAKLESGTIGGQDKCCTVDKLKFSVNGNTYSHPNINTFGGICGKITGGTVSHCKYKNSHIFLSIRGCEYTGGIVGEVAKLSTLNTQLPTLITDCAIEDISITSFNYAGGIVGKVDHPDCQIYYCNTSTTGSAYGTIYSDGSFAGGIVGWFNGDATNPTKCFIKDCYNDVKVNGNDHVGGIAGYASNCYVNLCYNYSNIFGISGYEGGIAGELTGKSTIEKCFNVGEINQYSNHGLTLHTGGIVGYMNAAAEGDNCLVQNSFNSYMVHGYNRVGGIAGMVEGNARLHLCYNTGVVKGIAQVGGLIGLQKNASETSDCYSAGKVEGSAMVGAVCGYATYETPNFANCYYDKQMVAYKGLDNQDISIAAKTHAEMVGSNFGLGTDNWTYAANHYPQLCASSLPRVSQASTLVFPLNDTQNATNLLHSKDSDTGDQITLPEEEGLTWGSDDGIGYLVIDNTRHLLYSQKRGIWKFHILNADKRPLHAIEANFGISAEQPIEICDIMTLRQFRTFINDDNSFAYSTNDRIFGQLGGSADVIIPKCAEGFYFKLTNKPANADKEETEKDVFWMVQEKIDPGDIRWTPIGDHLDFHQNSFRGKLDGNGHTVIIKCERPDQDYIGLFGYMEGHIKNLKVAASFQRNDIFIHGHDYVGAIAGFCNGTIENCSIVQSDSSAFVPTVTGNDHVGALVGRAEFSKIIKCENAYCYVSGTTSGLGFAGSVDENTIVTDFTSSTPYPNQIALCDNDSEKPDGDKNTDRISALYTKTYSNNETSLVALPGRIFYKDGCWNTLCLPFGLSAEQIAADGSPLKDISGLMELDTEGIYDGHKTGFDAATGTLYLYFKDANYIEAGKPYIFKYTRAADYTIFDYTTRILHDIHNPEFSGVRIDNSNDAQARMTVTSKDGYVSFKSTYSNIQFNETDKSVLFVGGKIDKHGTSNYSDDEFFTYLYYPKIESGSVPPRIGACRTYFQLNNGLTAEDVTNARMNFDSEANGITTTNYTNLTNSDAWYTLDGRKLSGKPTKKGIYIYKGKKVKK